MINKFYTTVLILVFFTMHNVLCMEENIFEQENHFSNYFSTVARSLHENFKSAGYISLYCEMLKEINALPYEGQVDALSHMIREVVDKNRSLTKKLCLVAMDLYQGKVLGTRFEKRVRDQIIEKILIFQGKSQQNIFKRLKNICLSQSSVDDSDEREKEKEKEEEPNEEILVLKQQFVESINNAMDFFPYGDLEGIKETLSTLFVEYSHLGLKEQGELLIYASCVYSQNSCLSEALSSMASTINANIQGRNTKKLLGTSSVDYEVDEWSMVSINQDVSKHTSLPTIYEQQVKNLVWGSAKNSGRSDLTKKASKFYAILWKGKSTKTGNPSLYDCIFFLPIGMTIKSLNLKTKNVIDIIMSKNNPLFVNKKEYKIPGLQYETFWHGDEKFFAYINNQEKNPIKFLLSPPYFIRAYADGVLEVDNVRENEHFSFRNKHFGLITALTIKNQHGLISSSLDGNLKLWNLKKKKCEHSIQYLDSIQDSTLFEDIIYFLSENNFHGGKILSWIGDKEFADININTDGVTAFKAREDGFILGMNNGNLKFIKIGNKMNAPKTVSTVLSGPIVAIQCIDELVIAQSDTHAAVVLIPID